VIYGLVKTQELATQNHKQIKINSGLIKQTHRASQRNDLNICLRLNNVNKLITLTLIQSKITIADVQYFRTHPTEKHAQIQQIDKALLLFKPRTCKGRG